MEYNVKFIIWEDGLLFLIEFYLEAR